MPVKIKRFTFPRKNFYNFSKSQFLFTGVVLHASGVRKRRGVPPPEGGAVELFMWGKHFYRR